MPQAKRILTLLFALLMVGGGISHFLRPEAYFAFIPGFLPKEMINYLAGVIELALGLGLLIPRVRPLATMGILILMIAFLPLHMWDVFRDDPAVKSHTVALVRLPLQFVLIFWSWYIHKK